MPLTTLLDLPGTSQGAHVGLVETGGGATLTYAQTTQAVQGVSAQLRAHGLAPGSVVSITLPNTIAFVALFLGAAQARLVAAPLNPKVVLCVLIKH